MIGGASGHFGTLLPACTTAWTLRAERNAGRVRRPQGPASDGPVPGPGQPPVPGLAPPVEEPSAPAPRFLGCHEHRTASLYFPLSSGPPSLRTGRPVGAHRAGISVGCWRRWVAEEPSQPVAPGRPSEGGSAADGTTRDPSSLHFPATRPCRQVVPFGGWRESI